MTTAQPNDPTTVVADMLASASPDLLRSMLSTFIQTVMGADADALCGAGYGERSPDRVNSRNGYRHRDFDTRVGTLDVAVPKLLSGSYFPDWLLERRTRANAPWCPSSRPRTCSGCRPGGWRSWSRRWA